MQLKRHSDSIQGSKFNAAVAPVVSPVNGAMLSEELALTTPPMFGMRISRGGDKIIVSDGVVHNPWLDGTTVNLGGKGKRVFITGRAVYPVGSYTDSMGASNPYRKPGPTNVEIDFALADIGGTDPTPITETLSERPIFLYLGQARKPTTPAEQEASIGGWFLDSISFNQFNFPVGHISALLFRIVYWNT